MTERAGTLISFDGVDSSGKETQAKLLAQRLRYQGYQVHEFTTPDYTKPSGQELKARLQGKLGIWDKTPWQQKMKLFSDNRAEHKTEVIEALARGDIVIYDRYVVSSLTFITVEALKPQEGGAKRQAIQSAVAQQEYEIMQMPHEDISIFLDVPPKVTTSLLEKRKEKLADQDEYTDHVSVQQRLYNEYDLLIKQQPERFIRVGCVLGNTLLSIEAISELVWEQLKLELPQLTRSHEQKK